MIRMDPPPLATWILEHLTPADWDDALMGDLVEQYRGGRSQAWYWRQVLGAFAIGWTQNLRERVPLLIFSALWGSLGPAWTAITDGLQNRAKAIEGTWHMDGAFATLSSFAVWGLTNLLFLSAGVVIFMLSHPGVARHKLVRAIGIAASLFLPLYFFTFVAANLLAWPGPVVDRRSLTPLGEITDVNLWADILRIPYCMTLVIALWRAVPRRMTVAHQSASGSLPMSRCSISPGRLDASLDIFTVKRFFAFVVCAGLMNAMLVSFLLCRLPDLRTPTLTALLGRAILLLLGGVGGGVCGAWLYWNNPASPLRSNPPVPFLQFALIGSTGWLWVAPAVLFYEQVSSLSAFVALVGALALAVALRPTMESLLRTEELATPSGGWNAPIFTESLYQPPGEAHGYVIACCLYGSLAAILLRSNFTGAMLLSTAGFLFAWRRTGTRRQIAGRRSGAPVLRLVALGIPALFLTCWGLLGQAQFHSRRAQLALGADPGAAKTAQSKTRETRATADGFTGYRSIILWPVLEKKQILPPLPRPASLLAPGDARPLTIRFNGAYWYVQPPERTPGRNAHQAVGSPLFTGIHPSNSLPILMEAHQRLGAPIALAACGKIRVSIVDFENRPGSLSLAMLLSDGPSPADSSIYINSRPVPGHSADQPAQAGGEKFIEFDLPPKAKIRRFDEITLMVLPDWMYTQATPRVAIEEFQFFAR